MDERTARIIAKVRDGFLKMSPEFQALSRLDRNDVDGAVAVATLAIGNGRFGWKLANQLYRLQDDPTELGRRLAPLVPPNR